MPKTIQHVYDIKNIEISKVLFQWRYNQPSPTWPLAQARLHIELVSVILLPKPGVQSIKVYTMRVHQVYMKVWYGICEYTIED